MIEFELFCIIVILLKIEGNLATINSNILKIHGEEEN